MADRHYVDLPQKTATCGRCKATLVIGTGSITSQAAVASEMHIHFAVSIIEALTNWLARHKCFTTAEQRRLRTL